MCSYDLSEEFFFKLGVKVYDIIPLRKVFVLFTDKGKKILKITNSSLDRINFINKVLNIIKEKDKYVLQYCTNSNGDIITEWKGKYYVLLDMMDGREATFTNPVEVEWCTKALANFHNASMNITDNLTKEDIILNKSKNLIYELLNDLCFITEAERVISKFSHKNDFDLLFLKNISKAKNDLNISINLLTESSYSELYSDLKNTVICHLDLAHHNFIIDEDKVNMIDFDYCKREIRTFDISNFMIKVLKRNKWDMSFAKAIIDAYNEVSNLEECEYNVLYAYLQFPQRYWRLANRYYYNEVNWGQNTFDSKLESIINEKDEYLKFLDEFKKKYNTI